MKWKRISWVISIAFLIYVLSRLTEYESLTESFRNGDLRWIAVAFLFQVVFFAALIELYSISFRCIGVDRTFRSMILVVFSGIFANTLTPSAGMAGTAVYVREGKRHNSSTVRSIVGFVIETVFQQFGFGVLLVIGFLYLLWFERFVSVNGFFAIVIVLVFIVFQLSVLGLFSWKSKASESIIKWGVRIGNKITKRFRGRELVPEEWSKYGAAELRSSMERMWKEKRWWLDAILFSVVMQASMVLTLVSLFHAFGQQVEIPTIFTGYIAVNIVSGLAIGPYAIGVVEAGLTVVLSQYGVPSGTAALIAILLRGLNFWIPFFAGFVSFRRLKLFDD